MAFPGQKKKLQDNGLTCMHSYLVVLQAKFLVRAFVYSHTVCMQAAMSLVKLQECAGLPKPSLLAYTIKSHELAHWISIFLLVD